MAARKKIRIARNKQHAWTIPQGPLKAFLEKKLASITEKKKREGYMGPHAALLADIDEMLEAPETDLAEFKRQQMPIKKEHFELLRLYRAELDKVGVSRRLERGTTASVSEHVAAAMASTLDAHRQLANRAAANGIPRGVLSVKHATGSPKTLYRACQEVLEVATDNVADFDSPAFARKLIANLKKEADALGELAGVRKDLAKERGATNKRKRLLIRSVYEYALWLSGFGKAMAGDDPDAQRRWRLDKTFPNQDAAADPKPAEVASKATQDPTEQDT